MKYQYLRIFLVKRERPPLLEAAKAVPERLGRTQYIQDVFKSRIDFLHRNKYFVYIPVGRSDWAEGSILFGRIGRVKVTSENEPPEAKFEDRLHEGWRAANIIIDSRDHSDGQKVAFQYRQDVGKALPILNSLANHINETHPDSGWFIEINLIVEETSFWEAYRRYKGEITAATFTFVTPNVLRMRARLNEELKAYRENFNAVTVTESIENPDGNLDLDNPEIKDSVKYVTEGGGSAKLKSGKTTLYDTEQQEKAITLDDGVPLAADNRSLWRNIAETLFGRQ